MSAKKQNAAIVGVGVAACAVCCAGPIVGVLAAIGLGTAAGLALFGSFVLVIGGAGVDPLFGEEPQTDSLVAGEFERGHA